ncbi:MAG: hypothetical protein HW405_642 [Candidatus Berkelbacteria bacterium]|nr:hypothetical protein [Candidatus Berkelbacteria bacterium]
MAITIILLPLLSYLISSDFYNKYNSSFIPIASAASTGDFGAVSFVSSLPNNSNKQTIVSEMSKLGVGWAREEYTYSGSIDFAPYDAAYSKLHAANLNILGLLTYSSGVSHAQWRSYVSSVVNHFSGVTAWEIMNEADNYLAPADYVAYLKEAHDIIKAKNSGATVVLSGITARVESPNFWNGVSAAGGWGYFDVAGLHIFHDGDPSQDSYNNGSLGEEVEHAIDSINQNGGGKSIWVTEFGWDSNAFGTDNQASWLSRGLETIHSYSEVGKIFVFRMFEQGNGFGLLNSSFAEKPSFNAVKDAISRIISGQSVSQPVDEPQSESVEESTTPQVVVNKENSSVRLDTLENLANGQKNYRIVVLVKDENGSVLTSVKPKIIIDGGPSDLTA